MLVAHAVIGFRPHWLKLTPRSPGDTGTGELDVRLQKRSITWTTGH
jgi:hypothetical protein